MSFLCAINFDCFAMTINRYDFLSAFDFLVPCFESIILLAAIWCERKIKCLFNDIKCMYKLVWEKCIHLSHFEIDSSILLRHEMKFFSNDNEEWTMFFINDQRECHSVTPAVWKFFEFPSLRFDKKNLSLTLANMQAKLLLHDLEIST